MPDGNVITFAGIKKIIFDLMVVLNEKSEHEKVVIHPEGGGGAWTCVPNSMEIHPVVETFQSKPQMSSSWWHDRKCE